MFGEENLNWVDTGYSSAMHTALFDPVKFFLIYKYEVYGVEYLNDGNETRDEESEQETPPQFCNRPIPFTVAFWEKRKQGNMLKFADSNSLKDNDLHVMSTKKPRLAEAGYKTKNILMFQYFLHKIVKIEFFSVTAFNSFRIATFGFVINGKHENAF